MRRQGLDQLDSVKDDLGPAQLIRGEGLGRMKAARSRVRPGRERGRLVPAQAVRRAPGDRPPDPFGQRAHELGGEGRARRHRRDGGVDEEAQPPDHRGSRPGRARPGARAASRRRRAASCATWISVRARRSLGPLRDARRKFVAPARQDPPVDDRRRRRVEGRRADGAGAVEVPRARVEQLGDAGRLRDAPERRRHDDAERSVRSRPDDGHRRPAACRAGVVPLAQQRLRQALGLGGSEPGVAQPRHVPELRRERGRSRRRCGRRRPASRWTACSRSTRSGSSR